MFGQEDPEDLTDEVRYGNYYDYEEDSPYTPSSGNSNHHSIKTYQQILNEPWLDEPLREIVETRLEDLLEG